MPERQLRQQIDLLNARIAELPAGSEQRRELQELVNELETRLAREQLPTGEHRDLRDQVERAISRFEAEHPTTAGVLRDIMTTLTSIGV